jgi:putative membrane protein
VDGIGYPVRDMDRVLQILVNAGALYVAVLIVPGLDLDQSGDDWWWKFLLVAVAFSLVNSYIRPVLRILTFPISMVTLGLFLLVINALMLMLTGAISEELSLGLTVADFWAALLGSIVISIVGAILSLVFGAGRMSSKVV